MRDRVVRSERGQVIVTVALIMVVMLILLALAVDVGHVYRQRRLMQNAADAGALAGARDICFGSGWNGSFDSEGHPARLVAKDYAFRNGAEEADVTIHGGGWWVTVLATEVTDTFFGGIIGMPTVDVGAKATAACGEAARACGLWPIAFKAQRWEELLDAALSAEYKCNVPFYVWAGDNPNQQPDCDVYDCDVNDDGIDDIVNQLQRAWLDFSDVVDEDPRYPDDCVQDGCGAAELVCYLLSDSGASIDIPTCIGGDTGVKAGTKAAVNERIGDVVAIPIFDTYCDGATCSGQDIHAIYFACIKVLGWDHSLELPRLDGALPPWKGPVIATKVECNSECSTRCGGTTGGPPPEWGVKAVSLIE